MSRTSQARAIALAAALAVGVAVVALIAGGSETVDAADDRDRPNIVVFFADDQHNRSMRAMPYMNSRDDWVKFSSAMVNTALCCPSRATMLTGLTSTNNGIESNSETALFNGQSTVAEWLNDDGYQTGFIGKYFNKFPWDEKATFVPGGWDYWVSYDGKQGYDRYTLNDNGTLVRKGKGAGAYSTDVFNEKAVEFIEDADPDRPFFTMVSYFGPHGPWVPAKRHRNADVPQIPETEAFLEKDVSDKPDWIASQKRPDKAELRADRLNHNRTILSLDDGVRDIFAALEAKGELDETIVLYTSDHGIAMGDHRYTKKNCAYEVCSRVPAWIRVPGIEGRREKALIGNIDFTPTFTDYAGIRTRRPVDGRSLRPLIEEERNRLHKTIYLRRAQGGRDKIYSGARTQRWKYVRYDKTGEEELYDLKRDPEEVLNLLSTGRKKWKKKAEALEAKMNRVRKTPPKVR